MQFTGKNLELVKEALQLAIANVHNDIATCPDVIECADEIEELELKQEKLKKLLSKIK